MGSVRVQSGKDRRTAVQIVRQLTLHPGSTHTTLHLEMVNIPKECSCYSKLRVYME
jgi:hypothetical protein